MTSQDRGCLSILISCVCYKGECPCLLELHIKVFGIIGHYVSNLFPNSEETNILTIFLEV